MKKILSVILLFCFASIIGYSQGTWAPLTSGTTVTLLGVSTPSSSLCFVCGAIGTIRKTSNAGSTWNPLSSGTGQNLHSILFIDILTGFVVGDNGTALKTTNGGTSWAPMTVGTTANLRFVYFFDSNNGFISGSGGLILKTVDGGSTWTPCTTGSTSVITSVWFTSSSVGYASGAGGTLLKTTTSGSTWSTLTSGVTSNLGIVQFTTPSNAIVCGDAGVIRQTTTSGTSWAAVTSGTPDNLTGLDFYDASNGFIVGGDVPLNTGNILRTTDGGNSWTGFAPGSSRLTKVDFYDENLGYAVGLDGTILQYTVPLPPAVPDGSFTSSTPGCVGPFQNFYSSMYGTPGVSHTWDFGVGAVPATSTLYNPSGILYSIAGAKVVTHIATTALGSDTVTNIITINPSPVANFSSTAPVCPGSAVDFSNAGSSGVGITYSWDFGGATPNISTISNPTGIVYATGGTKTVTFTVTNQYGCITTNTQTIYIDTLPSVNAGMDSTICFNTSVTIGDTTLSGLTYSWSPSATLSNSSISNPIASPVSATTNYILTVTNTTTGCSNKDTIMVTMLPVLVANAGSDEEICSNDSVQIGTGVILGQTYSWSPGADLNDSTLSNPISTPTATTTYTLTVSANGCSSVMDEVTVTVYSAPNVSAGIDDTTTVGSSVQLNATGGILYAWTPSATLDNPGIYNPIATPPVTTTYTVTITDLNGCKKSDAVKITVVEPTFWVPTAFSPDGNGISDIFYVRGEPILDFEFSVYNRWGERIFFTKDMLTGWDGTRQSTGDKLPIGAYVYTIRGTLSNGSPLDQKGMINLIR